MSEEERDKLGMCVYQHKTDNGVKIWFMGETG